QKSVSANITARQQQIHQRKRQRRHSHEWTHASRNASHVYLGDNVIRPVLLPRTKSKIGWPAVNSRRAANTATATERLRILSHGVECQEAQWRQNQLHTAMPATEADNETKVSQRKHHSKATTDPPTKTTGTG